MDVRQLRQLIILGEDAHYARAAERLGITQSALSRSVQALEKELGLRLFDRGRDGVRPTRAGERLLQEARLILQQMDMVRRDMSLLAERQTGQARLGVGPLPATLVLPTVLAKVARDHPGIHVHARIGGGEDLLAHVREGELDFAVLALPLVEQRAEQLTIRRLGQVRLAALVRAAHPLAGRAITDQDVSRFPIMSGTATAEAGSRLPYAPTLVCDNFDILRQVAMESDAIWITADRMAGDGGLVALRGVSIAQPVQLVAASLARRSLSPAALLLIDMIAAALASGEQPGRSPIPSS